MGKKKKKKVAHPMGKKNRCFPNRTRHSAVTEVQLRKLRSLKFSLRNQERGLQKTKRWMRIRWEKNTWVIKARNKMLTTDSGRGDFFYTKEKLMETRSVEENICTRGEIGESGGFLPLRGKTRQGKQKKVVVGLPA